MRFEHLEPRQMMSVLFSQDAYFSTGGQSLWGAGQAQRVEESYFFGSEWNDSDVNLGNLGPGGAAYLRGQLDAGRLGLEATIQATTGTVDVQYPVRVTYETPDSYVPGGPVTIVTGYELSGDSLLKAMGPNATFDLDLVADVQATGEFGVVWGALPEGTPLPSGVVIAEDFAFGTGGTQSVGLFDWKTGGTALGAFTMPEPITVTTTKADSNGDMKASGTANSRLFEFSADLDAIATTLAGLPRLGGELDLKSGDLDVAQVSYDILDLELKGGPSLYQEFEFDMRGLNVVLRSSNGETQTGRIGDTFTFTAPESGELEIEALVTLDQRFTSRLGLVGDLDLTATVGAIGVDLFGHELLDIGPVFKDTYSLAQVGPVFLYEKGFVLSGFQTASHEIIIRATESPSEGIGGQNGTTAPDYVATSLLVGNDEHPLPQRVEPGSEVPVFFKIANPGGGSGEQASTMRIYLSPDREITGEGNDILVHERTIFPLTAPAGADADWVNIRLPDLEPGEYFVGVLADADDVLLESEEGNNVRLADNTITVLRPNAAPSIIELTVSPNSVEQGEHAVLTADGVRDPDGEETLRSVCFYRDTNGNGQWDKGIDELLHTDRTPNDGWSVAVPTQDLSAETHRLFAVATDDQGAESSPASTTLDVKGPPDNLAPFIEPIFEETATVGETVSVQIMAYDTNHPAQKHTYRLIAGMETGAVLDPDTGVLQWTPSAGQIGRFEFVIEVSDDADSPLTATESFSITVQPAPLGPEVEVVGVPDNKTVVDFGRVQQGADPTERPFVIRNVGDQPLKIYAVRLENNDGYEIVLPQGVDAFPAQVISPGAHVSFAVRMFADKIGLKAATVRIFSDDADENPLCLSVTGEVTAGDPVVTAPNHEDSGSSSVQVFRDDFNAGTLASHWFGEIARNHAMWTDAYGTARRVFNDGTSTTVVRGFQDIYNATTYDATAMDVRFSATPAGPAGGSSLIRFKFMSSDKDRDAGGLGYGVDIRAGGGIELRRFDQAGETALIDAGIIAEAGQTYEIRVVRDAQGRFELFVNGKNRGSAVDTTYTQSNYLVVSSNGDGAEIDSIEITTPKGESGHTSRPTPEQPGDAPAGGSSDFVPPMVNRSMGEGENADATQPYHPVAPDLIARIYTPELHRASEALVTGPNAVEMVDVPDNNPTPSDSSVPKVTSYFKESPFEFDAGSGVAVRSPLDVSGDGDVTPLDALTIINEINLNGQRELFSLRGPDRGLLSRLDVNWDGALTWDDANCVINALNEGGDAVFIPRWMLFGGVGYDDGAELVGTGARLDGTEIGEEEPIFANVHEAGVLQSTPTDFGQSSVSASHNGVLSESTRFSDPLRPGSLEQADVQEDALESFWSNQDRQSLSIEELELESTLSAVASDIVSAWTAHG